ncbi:MAG TPA: adenylyltransferase/cytidyltransferase family protein [Pyrinomonadaceae bacterium]|nr:adenylyltransferase/cytidyltransferase family protein [Pyrinomonadaceae bacterium]
MLLDNTTLVSNLSMLHDKLRGQTVVLATGCFDLLHIGHLYFLSEARKQGDVLVVGINSDNSVRTIKGTNRPIIKQEDRLAVVAALRLVDWAFVFDDVAAEESILLLRPDVFAMGEESVASYPGELAAAQEVGARLHVVKRIPEASSTGVITNVLKMSQP